jgi:hypothetical protein
MLRLIRYAADAENKQDTSKEKDEDDDDEDDEEGSFLRQEEIHFSLLIRFCFSGNLSEGGKNVSVQEIERAVCRLLDAAPDKVMRDVDIQEYIVCS